MKNFLTAFGVFLIWAVCGMLYLEYVIKPETSAFMVFEGSMDAPEDFFEDNGLVKRVFWGTADSTIIENNSLLVDDLKKTINSNEIKKQRQNAAEANDTLLHAAKDTMLHSGTLIYPRYSYGELIVDEQLKAWTTDLERSLLENPKEKITIVGHTDNVGNDVDNYLEGLKRAKQIKWYLTNRLGIDPERILATSKGESQPLISGDNEKNNRIQLLIGPQ